MKKGALALTATALALCGADEARAQRADDNAVRAADDAFGVSVGNERVGLYSDRDTRGFSPINAGNVRMEGLYFDARGNLPSRVIQSSTVRVGLTAQSYAFPAPTGIVDYTLRVAGDEPSLSTYLQLGPNEGWAIEFDARTPLDGPRLGVSAGMLWRREEPTPDDDNGSLGFGLTARWRPTDSFELKPFVGYGMRLDDKVIPLVFTAGPFLPPRIEAHNTAQEWTRLDGHIETWGATARTRLSSRWSLDTGLFHYGNGGDGLVSDLFLNVDPNGVAAAHRFSHELENDQTSESGEIRLSGAFNGERVRQTLLFSLRGRSSERGFGGAAVTTIVGPVPINPQIDIPEPNWVFGSPSRDEVRQSIFGVGYQVRWRGLGEASLGIQQVNYEKTVTPPGLPATVTRDEPLFGSGSVAWTVTDRLALYASFTRGLEESPIAPEVAVNAQESPPAIRTRQEELGLRYAITPRLKLVVGYFDVRKPYFNLDSTNFFRQLGVERHAGAEISLAGAVTPRLNVVAGVILMEPEVTGIGVTSGQIGPRPVSQAETTVKLNFDYRTPWIEGLSVDAAFNYVGERAATSRTFAELGDEQLMTNPLTTLDLGLRYRFHVGERANMLRFQVTNVADAFAWQVLPSGALYVNNPRSYMLSLTTDF